MWRNSTAIYDDDDEMDKYKENSDIKWVWSPGLEIGYIMMH